MTRYRVKLFVAEGVIAADQFAKPLSRALVSDPIDAHRGVRNALYHNLGINRSSAFS